MVKLLEGSNSDSTQQKLLEGMGRMGSEQSVRGIMIQQGCLSACLQLDKGVRIVKCPFLNLLIVQIIRTEEDTTTSQKLCCQNAGHHQSKYIDSFSAIRFCRTINQSSERQQSAGLNAFEALLSLTNLAGFDNETKNRIIASSGIPIISYAIFPDHEM
ncbi:hypothetical protein ACHAW6_008230, partial [Cyclotella cf. meneghiniana]